MPTAKLLVNEKAINLQTGNVYVLAFDDPGFSLNKIEMEKALKGEKLTPIDIRVVNLPRKKKIKGAKRTKVTTKRAKKYYVKLKDGEKIDENFELKIEA